MTRKFDHVYRITELTDTTVSAAEIDALERGLPVPLLIGYREYMQELGCGRLCDSLRVQSPQSVREDLTPDEAWQREGYLMAMAEGAWKAGVLTKEDLELAVGFADSSEYDWFVSVPRFPGALFQIPEYDSQIRRLENGFFDAVENAKERKRYEFTFFEAYEPYLKTSGFMRHQCYEFPPTMSVEQFIVEAHRRWGGGGFRELRESLAGCSLSLFFRQIQGRLVVYAGEQYTTECSLPRGTFSVVAYHDPATRGEIEAFFKTFDAVWKFEK